MRPATKVKEEAMRKIVSILVLFVLLLGVAAATARGGRDSADCPPKSTDPDCK
jgi:hypothetical protein